MDDTALAGWVTARLARLTETCTDLPWTDATSERTTAITETQAWPFEDADQHDPLAALRIPVVRNPYPHWKYEVALVISEDDLWGPALRPDDAEVRQLTAFLEYRMEYYNEGWKAKMRRRPLDVDGTTNTVTLMKRADGDWRYQKATWQHGPWPFYDMPQRFTLETLLDHINDFGSKPNQKWRAFKAAHPEAFPASSEEQQS